MIGSGHFLLADHESRNFTTDGPLQLKKGIGVRACVSAAASIIIFAGLFDLIGSLCTCQANSSVWAHGAFGTTVTHISVVSDKRGARRQWNILFCWIHCKEQFYFGKHTAVCGCWLISNLACVRVCLETDAEIIHLSSLWHSRDIAEFKSIKFPQCHTVPAFTMVRCNHPAPACLQFANGTEPPTPRYGAASTAKRTTLQLVGGEAMMSLADLWCFTRFYDSESCYTNQKCVNH